MNGDPREKILIVDDNPALVEAVGAILSNHGFRFESASNGPEGFGKARDLSPDIVFLDITMPGMDGFETCRKLKEDSITRGIPVVMITASTDRESRIKALEAGANDFIGKPIDGTELIVRVNNLLKVKRYQNFLEEHSRILESQVQERTRQFKESMLDTVSRLTLAAEYRDVDTYNHVSRISYYAEFIGRELGMDDDAAEIIYHASPMHDIGKVGIPDSILLKPGKLSKEEFEIIKTHTTIGARILRGSSSPYLKAAELIALTHHERFDGTGYPQGLKGEEIPIEGRIVSLADQYDALRCKRPYKLPYDHESAADLICGKGRIIRPEHFDPEILRIFKDKSERFREIFEAHPSL